ncbi:unnamed protein product, partial [Durusdinium trenchii]
FSAGIPWCLCQSRWVISFVQRCSSSPWLPRSCVCLGASRSKRRRCADWRAAERSVSQRFANFQHCPLGAFSSRPPSNAQQRCELHGPRAAPARLVTAENVTGVATLRTQGELRITGSIEMISLRFDAGSLALLKTSASNS